MTGRLADRGGRVAGAAPRVGLFGLLGSGNSGNDASLETMLTYLREAHPEAVVDAMCGGADRVRASYGIGTVPIFWFSRFEQRTSGMTANVLKALGKGVDTVRTAAWVRRHDAVIVPGAGALETTLPQRAWGFPYSLFVLTLSGKLFGTRVALVSVGADAINKRVTRWLSDSTARMASYRSYRDGFSRDIMRQRGLDVSEDEVYPDLVFGVPTPPYDPGDARTVGLGVMAYHGSNDDRERADQIHSSYLETMTHFTGWLVDNGYRVRVFGGDNKFDGDIADQILADVRRDRPDLEPSDASAVPSSSYAELMRQMSPCGIVVATRYHNVMCALKLCKPTISLGYSQKFVSLMADMGLGEFSQFAYSLDVDQLIEQFKQITSRHAELRRQMAARNADNRRRLDHQFEVLSARLLPGRPPAPAQDGGELAGRGAAG